MFRRSGRRCVCVCLADRVRRTSRGPRAPVTWSGRVGRPPARLRVRADSRPSRVPSLMRSAVILSMAAMTWSRNRRAGVVVSMRCLSTIRSMLRSLSAAASSVMCRTERNGREGGVITSSSPWRRCSKHLSLSGRCVSLPVALSTQIRSHPGSARASIWESSFCSRVDTRAYPNRAMPGAVPYRADMSGSVS
jgi:hypothetical protein